MINQPMYLQLEDGTCHKLQQFSFRHDVSEAPPLEPWRSFDLLDSGMVEWTTTTGARYTRHAQKLCGQITSERIMFSAEWDSPLQLAEETL
jgi:hypothetical protein